ncbi:MAG: lysophospholipid acyltransferase family protein [Bacillota bacterium]
MFYATARAVLRVILRIAFKIKVEGHENVPRQGPVILVANHLSMLDPIVLGCAISRPIRFMAKHELFSNRLFAYVLTRLGAFPVRRGHADKEAFHTAFEVLSKGQVLGMFPEGTRSLNGGLQPPYSGAAILAEKTGAPVVPVGIVGTGRIMRKGAAIPRYGRITVRVGRPIYAAGSARVMRLEEGARQEFADVKDVMMRHIAELIASGL